MQSAKSLLDSYTLGDIKLKNRVVMASMTRLRADADNIPGELMVKYYTARASAGLIMTESTAITKDVAFPGAAGIWNQDQVKGWKKVVDAVHAKGGKIFIQLWHAGRTVPNGLAPSALPVRKMDKEGVETKGPVPKEMTHDDIKAVIELYKQAAVNAKSAGFDGIEINGANGYIVDQFLRDGTNKRTDEYGGSIEKRCRFALEVLDALISVWGSKKVGIKLSPVGRAEDMYDSNPTELYTYLLKKLSEKKLLYVQVTEASPKAYEGKTYYQSGSEQIPKVYKVFRPHFQGPFIANCGFNPETAEKVLQKDDGDVDLVAFGSLYINNPDLVERIKNKYPLDWNLDQATFFGGGEKGYLTQQAYKAEGTKFEKEDVPKKKSFWACCS